MSDSGHRKAAYTFCAEALRLRLEDPIATQGLEPDVEREITRIRDAMEAASRVPPIESLPISGNGVHS